MTRRYALAPVRGLALVALAAVGLALGAVQFAAACLVGPYNVTVEATRLVVNLARRLAGRWSGVEVPVPYRSPPPPPAPRADGLYEHDGSLYRSPVVPRFLRRAGWLAADPATARDWFWLIVNLPTGGVLAGLPAGLVIGGVWVIAVPSTLGALPSTAAVVAGAAAVVAGVAVGPSALRLHGWLTWRLLRPLDTGGWRNAAAVRWFRSRHSAVWRGAAVVGLSVAALGVALWHVVMAVWTGGFGLVWSVPAGRRVTDLYRRFAGEWAGVPIDRPYRPQEFRLVMEPDGRYKVGRWLVADRAAAMRHLRLDWVVRDKATYRDLAWAFAAPVVSLPLLLPVVLVGFGLYGLVWQPMVWPLWGVPVLVIGGTLVTPWYMWLIVTAATSAFDWVPHWLSPVIGAALTAVGLALAPVLLRVHARFSRSLLAPSAATVLARRVAHLTESRSDAVDAQAAELRRIERDLHDGAQSRLIAVGLSLGAVERLIDSDPAAAKDLLRQARTTSATALADLRDLVRGIHPPVLAERGLGDAVRAIALDTPLPVRVTSDLSGRLPAPVESAAYFAVTEVLTNAVRHSGSRSVSITIGYAGGVLRLCVVDDGHGGADPAKGSGLAGVRRRLGTFDGTVGVDSPPGGPTVVTMTVPCPAPGSAEEVETDVVVEG